MLDLNDFFYFVQVVDRGGFTAASRSLQIPKSTLSYRIQQLETALGARLINRTSRQFHLTRVGVDFYRHAVSMLHQAELAEGAVRQVLSEPSGTIRITTPATIAQFTLKDVLPRFMLTYPKVSIVHHTSNDIVDIVAENYDLAIRAHSGPLPNSTLVQRTLTTVPWNLFASSAYLDREGVPDGPNDLANHSALFMERGRSAIPVWKLSNASMDEVIVPLQPRFVSSDMVALKQAACTGLGIVALPQSVCHAEIESGKLTCVLPEWTVDESTLTILMPFKHGALPSVRAFSDFLIAEFSAAVKF